ncbi:MAG: AraC family transcriptional regulator ligand-binding domain-containing protein [Pseudomonadales bacterium]
MQSTIYSERMFNKFEQDLGPCADELGIPRAIFRKADVEFPIEKYYRMLECAARKSNPCIGFTMGTTLEMRDLGALGHAAAAAPNVGHALNLLAQYLYVFAQANVLRVDIGQEAFVIDYHLTDALPAIHQQDVELAMSMIAGVIRELSGQEICPLVAEFEHPKPPYSRQLQQHFHCQMQFNRSSNRLHYRKHVLDLPVGSCDARLLEALDFYLADRLKLRSEDDDLVAKVNHLIATTLNSGPPEIETIASTLGVSRRTLQRRLSDANLIFSDMVEAVRKNIANEYVEHSDYSLTDIALMLGYSELSSFSRAFRRWTGKSPQEVRETAA